VMVVFRLFISQIKTIHVIVRVKSIHEESGRIKNEYPH